ncbi:hypothetical protein ACFE04_009770 [Oxalis oulophora]
MLLTIGCPLRALKRLCSGFMGKLWHHIVPKMAGVIRRALPFFRLSWLLLLTLSFYGQASQEIANDDSQRIFAGSNIEQAVKCVLLAYLECCEFKRYGLAAKSSLVREEFCNLSLC